MAGSDERIRQFSHLVRQQYFIFFVSLCNQKDKYRFRDRGGTNTSSTFRLNVVTINMSGTTKMTHQTLDEKDNIIVCFGDMI